MFFGITQDAILFKSHEGASNIPFFDSRLNIS